MKTKPFTKAGGPQVILPLPVFLISYQVCFFFSHSAVNTLVWGTLEISEKCFNLRTFIIAFPLPKILFPQIFIWRVAFFSSLKSHVPKRGFPWQPGHSQSYEYVSTVFLMFPIHQILIFIFCLLIYFLHSRMKAPWGTVVSFVSSGIHSA